MRKKINLSQQQLANLSDVNRATIAQIETGISNPTLEVLMKLSLALKISIDNLIAPARAECRLIRAHEIPLDNKSKNGVILKKLLPEKIPSLDIDELNLEVDALMTGSPHLEGTREYFTCIKGEILISVLGEKFHLKKGDVLTFPGDNPHSYKNIGKNNAQGISVIFFGASSAFTI